VRIVLVKNGYNLFIIVLLVSRLQWHTEEAVGATRLGRHFQRERHCP